MNKLREMTMRALVIREPWISDILAGRKIWELRSRNSHIRGKIGLIRKGSGLIVGTVDLVDVVALPEYEMKKREEHGQSESGFGNSNRIIYAWVLENVKKLERPIPYKHPSGAVIWVKVPDLK